MNYSFEFFPPRNQLMERRLWKAIGLLERLKPQFFSMTYGALGSQQSTQPVQDLRRESPIPTAAHLTFAGGTRDMVREVASEFRDAGIDHIVALRGDDRGEESDGVPAGERYTHVADMITDLKDVADFEITVAAYPEVHPQAENAAADLRNLKQKLDAGADRAATQFFFDVDKFLAFRDRAVSLGISQPIVPGILPIHDLEKVRSFAGKCGAVMPEDLVERFSRVGNNAGDKYQLAVEQTVEQCERLLDEGVEAFHFYTLNRADLCFDVCLALGSKVRTSAQEVEDPKAAA